MPPDLDIPDENPLLRERHDITNSRQSRWSNAVGLSRDSPFGLTEVEAVFLMHGSGGVVLLV